MSNYEVNEGLAHNTEFGYSDEIDEEYFFSKIPIVATSTFGGETTDNSEIIPSLESELDLLHKGNINDWFPDGLWEGFNMKMVREELYSLGPSNSVFTKYFSPNGYFHSNSTATQDRWTILAEAMMRYETNKFRNDYDGERKVCKRVRRHSDREGSVNKQRKI